MIQMTQLKSGLRVITDYVSTVESVAFGVWFDVGARDEEAKQNGIAHMVEHMMFKGTPSRSAKAIAEDIENVGGNMNAYTSREVTAYYVHLLKQDVPLAIDVLSDILQHSTFDQDELERERQVIIQEIGMVQDTPDDLVFDHYQEAAFPNQSVGSPILGKADVISAINREALQNYTHNRYTPAQTVISVAGPIDHDDIVQKIEKAFSSQPANQNIKRKVANYKGGDILTERELEQSHVILGLQGVSRTSDDYYAASVFSTILGGGMSSRLFQEIREKRGLVYAIYSFHMGLIDNGLFGIYAGTGPESLSELVPVAIDELKKASTHIQENELNRAKAQIRADMLMGRERMMTRADQQAKFLIYHNDIFDPQSILDKIESLTQQDIQNVAQKLLQTQPTIAALGPLNDLPDLGQITEKIAA